MTPPEDQMSRTSGHFIIVSEHARHIWQIQFTPTRIKTVAVALFVTLCLVLFVRYSLPPMLSDADHVRIQEENLSLRVETRNLTFKMQKLSSEIARLEDMSGRIQHHIEAD